MVIFKFHVTFESLFKSSISVKDIMVKGDALALFQFEKNADVFISMIRFQYRFYMNT